MVKYQPAQFPNRTVAKEGCRAPLDFRCRSLAAGHDDRELRADAAGLHATRFKYFDAFTGDGRGARGIGADVYAVGCWKDMDVVRKWNCGWKCDAGNDRCGRKLHCARGAADAQQCDNRGSREWEGV